MAHYFEHYSSLNDLTPEGRRSKWRHFDRQFLSRMPGPDASPRVVDLGCGAGVLLEWLRARGYLHVRGVDRDPGQVDFAASLGLPVELSTDSAAWLREGESVDVVILKDVIEHLSGPQTDEVLRAIADRLSPGGRLLLTTPNANASFAARMRYNDPTHFRSYTEFSLRSDLRRNGLRTVEVTSDDVWVVGSPLGHLQQALKRMFRVVRRMEAAAEFGVEGWRLPLGLNLLAVAERDE